MHYKNNWFACCLFTGFLAGLGSSITPGQEGAGIANEVVDRQRRESGNQDGPAGTQSAASPETRQEQQQSRNAQALIRELTSLTPGPVAADTDLFKAYQQAAALFLTGNGQQAAEVLQTQVQANPIMPPVELLVAGMLYAVNEAQRGQVVLESLAVSRPDYPGTYIAFARLAINQRRYTDAGALLEKAERKIRSGNFETVEQAHFDSQLYDSLTQVALRQRRFDDARRHVQDLLNVSPEDPKAFLALAELDFEGANIDAALANLQKFYAKQQDSRVPELVLSTWYFQQGKADESGLWVEKAASKYPENASVQIEYANYCVNTERFAKANDAIKSLETKQGETPATTVLKGKIAFASESYGMAAFHYEKLFRQQPNSFDAGNMYALALVESPDREKREQALQIAQRNYRQLPNNQIAQAALGWVLLRLGQPEQAAALLSRAARTTELPPEIAYYLATYMQQTNKSQQARLVLEPALKRKNFFLYRSAAQRLMDEIAKAIGGDPLPPPATGDKDKQSADR